MKTILIIEDEASLVEPLAMKLGSAGYEVLTVSNGEDGLQAALTSKPDLILLDVMMPKMDGIQMLEKLRQDEWGAHAHVIIFTNAEDDLEKMARAVDDGVTDYLGKDSWNLDQIVGKVQEILK